MPTPVLDEKEAVRLMEQFLEFIDKQKVEIMEELKEFQVKHKDTFRELKNDSTSEHRHEWTAVYNEYIALLEQIAERFYKIHDLDNDQFIQIVELLQERHNDLWMPFQTLLFKTDYTVFSRCLADGVCLCCGEQFQPDGSHPDPPINDDDDDDDDDNAL